MPESKHTPGPWIVRGKSRFRPGYVDIDSSLSQETNRQWKGLASVVVRMAGDVADNAEGQANACLISAAPDLLEVLREGVASYGRPGGPWNMPKDPGGWIGRAQAAIAKAEGRSDD